MSNLTQLHLELTRRCPIECPKCPRTIDKGVYKANTDLSLSLLKQSLKGEYLDLIICSGNLGDPIYHPNLFEILEFLKTKCKIIKLHTNGSGKNNLWWETYFNTIRKTDITVFGLDGLEDTNQIYRKNQNWQQVFDAMKYGRTINNNIVWQWIPFKHNEDQINEAKALAKRHYIRFLLLKSHRWEDNDPMKPSNKSLYVDTNALDFEKN